MQTSPLIYMGIYSVVFILLSEKTMAKKTKAEVKKFYAGMRSQWKEAKELSLKMLPLQKKELEKIQKVLPAMSPMGYMFCKKQMENQGLNGLPWLDCKTFKGRKESGFVVKKWEHAKVHGLSRIAVWDEWKEFRYPKVYNLFHSSQVEAIK